MRPQIEGWTSDAEARALGQLAAGRRVLEVGTYRGFGAVVMAQERAEVWAVDWHRGDPDLGPRDTLCAWWTNVRRHHVEDQVVGLVGRVEMVLPLLRPASFDMAFIDGYHAYHQVVADIQLVLPLLRVGAALAFHDYSSTWPGVVNAVNEFRQRAGAEDWRLVDSLAMMTLPSS